MGNKERRFLAALAYAGNIAGGNFRIEPACVRQFNGVGWLVQVGDTIEPKNLTLTNASSGESWQVIGGEEPGIGIGSISDEQQTKLDDLLNKMAQDTLGKLFGASVAFTNFITEKYPEFFEHMKQQAETVDKQS